MTNPNIITPSVFISYSWSSPNHEQWVVNLAEELMSNGVKVTIDKWDLNEGNDLYSFMEEMVNSENIDKVLCIIDDVYTDKANSRSGGVGTEAQIISPKIYGNSRQEKFIPIVTKLDENKNPYLPSFFEGKIYLDFSELSNYSESFEKLLRNLYKRPINSKPALGNAPSFLFDEVPNIHQTNKILREFNKQIEINPSKVNQLIRDFTRFFYDELIQYELKIEENSNHEETSKAMYDSIYSYIPLRDNYIEFIEKLIRSDLQFDVDILINFFEKLPLLTFPRDNRGSWKNIEFEFFKFVIHELFLYTIALALKHENYNLIEDLLYSDYFVYNKYGIKSEPVKFDNFYYYSDGLKSYYSKTFQDSYLNPTADIIMKRLHESLENDIFVDADLICHYISILEKYLWFPITYIYKRNPRFLLFDKLVSKKHFEKVKHLFGVNTPEELKEKLIQLSENYPHRNGLGYFKMTRNILPIFQIIPTDKLCTLR